MRTTMITTITLALSTSLTRGLAYSNHQPHILETAKFVVPWPTLCDTVDRLRASPVSDWLPSLSRAACAKFENAPRSWRRVCLCHMISASTSVARHLVPCIRSSSSLTSCYLCVDSQLPSPERRSTGLYSWSFLQCPSSPSTRWPLSPSYRYTSLTRQDQQVLTSKVVSEWVCMTSVPSSLSTASSRSLFKVSSFPSSLSGLVSGELSSG